MWPENKHDILGQPRDLMKCWLHWELFKHLRGWRNRPINETFHMTDAWRQRSLYKHKTQRWPKARFISFTNIRRSSNSAFMLSHRLRRWDSMKAELGQRLMFSEGHTCTGHLFRHKYLLHSIGSILIQYPMDGVWAVSGIFNTLGHFHPAYCQLAAALCYF